MYKYVGRDQFNNVYWIKESPRKELVQQCRCTTVHKLYRDIGNISTHIGYTVGGLHIELFNLSVFNFKQSK
jgi:hypothetical protein